jgi:hypothetical protein
MATKSLNLNISVVEYGHYTHNETIGVPAIQSSKQRLEYSFPNATNFNNHFIALSED